MALTIVLFSEAALTGAWLAGLLPFLSAYSLTTLALVGLRLGVALGQVIAGLGVSRGTPSGLVLARWMFPASAALLSLELGTRLTPTNVFPSHRWGVALAYWVYAAMGVWASVRAGRRPS